MGQAEGSLGAQLEERYFRQKVKLGQGSFGTVWRAVDRQNGNTVAIKQLDKASMPRRGVRRADVDREISLMRAIRHDNVIQLFETFEDNNSIYMALEYCDDGDFGDKIKEFGLGLEEKDAAEWMRQMCDAVCVLHTQNICHRDIKPDNFMVHRRTVLKLADFGLATIVPKNQMITAVCGTPAFNAPEQHQLAQAAQAGAGGGPNPGGYSFPVDMWAVGVSMYMVMFGGKHPFLDEGKKLDINVLLSGKMDFCDQTTAAGRLGLGVAGVGLRFSEQARNFCRRLVDPDPHRRPLAGEAVYEPWLRLAQGSGAHRQRTPSRHRTPQRSPQRSTERSAQWTPQRRPSRQLGSQPAVLASPPSRQSRNSLTPTSRQRTPSRGAVDVTPKQRSKLLPSTPRVNGSSPQKNVGGVPTPVRGGARQRSASIRVI